MKTTDIYQRYYEASGEYNGIKRRAASVKLTAESDCGMIKYELSVNFFPHMDNEDFAVSYDAYFSKILYEGKGRRQKKREQAYLSDLRNFAEALAKESGGKIYFDLPLTDAKTA